MALWGWTHAHAPDTLMFNSKGSVTANRSAARQQSPNTSQRSQQQPLNGMRNLSALPATKAGMKLKYKLELKVSSYTTSFLFKNTENVKFIISQLQTTAKKGTYVIPSWDNMLSEMKFFPKGIMTKAGIHGQGLGPLMKWQWSWIWSSVTKSVPFMTPTVEGKCFCIMS